MPTSSPQVIPPETPFVDAVRRLIARVEATFPSEFHSVVKCYVVGGCAVHLYTGHRVSSDLDVKFEPRILLRGPATVMYEGGAGKASVSLDRSYMDVLGLMHPDWQASSRPWDVIGRVRTFVISPLDLAVSKVARFEGNDHADISALARHGLLCASAFMARCKDALEYYVGDTTFVNYNIRDAIAIIEGAKPRPPRMDPGPSVS